MPAPTRNDIIQKIQQVENDPLYAQSLSSFEIPNDQTVGLLAYCSAIDNPPPSPEEKAYLAKFLDAAMGNMELNNNISVVVRGSLRDTGLSSIHLGELRTFSFKTRHFPEFEAVSDKMREVNTHLQAGTDLDPSRRLTLKEYAAVSDMSKINGTLEKLNNLGLLEGNKRLTKLYEDSKIAKDLVSKLDSEYKRTMEVQPGTIVFDNTQKKSKVRGMAMSFYDKLVDKIITKHTHASKLYMGSADAKNPDAGEQTKISHINPRHEDRKFDMGEFLYADTYRIDLEKLISSKDKQELQRKLGDNWKEVLNSEYKAIERDLHDRNVKNLGGVSAAPDKQQTKAGLMTFTGKIGYKKFSKTNFNDIHQKMFSDHYKKNQCEMLCSAFVAHTTVAALVELNKRIAEKHQVDVGHDVVKIPIGKHENLKVMHPDRLLSVLKGKGCLQKVEGPEAVRKFVKKD